ATARSSYKFTGGPYVRSLIIAGLILANVAIFAQTQKRPQPAGGVIQGIVQSGNMPLPGVTVAATNFITNEKVTTSTDLNGPNPRRGLRKQQTRTTQPNRMLPVSFRSQRSHRMRRRSRSRFSAIRARRLSATTLISIATEFSSSSTNASAHLAEDRKEAGTI